MNTPMVSVWLITYNHEAYIAKAIEGVLMQQTRFAVEVVIGDDCSTDGTRAIVQSYKDRYPDRITLFLPEHNMGMLPILRPTFAMCRGKYVAMLDGDDYWTDPLKLQKQVDQLEADAKRMFAFHHVHIRDEIKGITQPALEPRQGSYAFTLADFLQPTHPVVTLSVLFRNKFNGVLPGHYYHLPYPDLALLILLLLEGGEAVYLPEAMGVYRIHNKGAFSGLVPYERFESRIEFFEKLLPNLPSLYHSQVNKVLGYHYYELMVLALRKLDMSRARRYFDRMSRHDTTLVLYHRHRSFMHDVFATCINTLSFLYKKSSV